MRKNAINPNFSVWVNASAGTGKTKILIDRVLRLLLENKQNILCLTFTNAAASEMENRIYNTLSKWAICSNSELTMDLEQLLDSKISDYYFVQARKLFSELENLHLTIQTIHAFCYRLISNFPIEAGIVPNCTLSECKELHPIVFDKVLNHEALQNNISVIAAEIDENKLGDLLYTLCIKRPANNLEYIKDKLNAPDEMHDLSAETTEHIERLAGILSDGSKRDQNYSKILHDWCNSAKSSVIRVADTGIQMQIPASRAGMTPDLVDSSVSYSNDDRSLAEPVCDEKFLEEAQASTTEYLDVFEERRQALTTKLHSEIELCKRSNRIEDMAKIFIKSESHEKKNISSIITKSILEKFPEAEQLIESVQDAVFSYVADLNAYQIFERTSNLFSIFKVYIDLYNSEKSKNALLDYNDIIDLATNLLSNHDYKDWVLFSLDQKIDHILVDEAQDNSISQWKIITSLCDEFFAGSDEKRTLFVVGDVKQSIYRFQGANPILFNYMQQYFHEKTAGRDWLSCQLEKSFRSTPEVLTFVDRLFNNFREEVSFSDNEIKHIPHRENDQGYIEIWPPLPRNKENDQQALRTHLTCKENYIADRSLAQTIARKIHNWLNEGRILVAKDRHIEPRDIMILVRQRNVLVDYIISELKKANVPVVGRDYFRIMDYIAVQDLIALAEFLLLSANDLALANVLKSPLFNFTEDDLFNIAYDRKEQSLWERLQNYSESICSELNNLINLSRTESPLALFTHILRAGKKKFAARLGLECLEIIDEFMHLLLQYENENTPSLQAFVQWIKENNPEIKNDMQSERNAVRIMTIHKSKGLQSPIVFLVDTNTVPRNSESIIFDETGAPFWCSKNSNAYCDQVKREKKSEDYNEYLRLLYVALTRAEDELYILGKEPVQKGSWYDLLTTHGEPYEKKLGNLYPMFKEEVEILCVNSNYPYIYKKRDYFDVSVISLPPGLAHPDVIPAPFPVIPTLSHVISVPSHVIQVADTGIHASFFLDSSVTRWNDTEATATQITDGYTRGLIIHSILQYMPKIEKERRKNWVKKYLENINISENKNEIYDKVLAFNEKYDYLFDLEGKSEIALSGMINDEAVLVRLDRLCITQDKAIIVDYKSHRNVSTSSLNEIKKQMLTYKTLVQELYPDKQVECMVIWVEDLTTTFFCHENFSS